MKKIHCLNNISKCGTDRLPQDYVMTDSVGEAEGVLVRSANMHEMQLPESLLAVARAGAGVNNIPLDACAQEGIVVFNTPGANANGVKEMVLAGMLIASRDLIGGIEWCRSNADDENIAKATEKSKKPSQAARSRARSWASSVWAPSEPRWPTRPRPWAWRSTATTPTYR